MERTVHIDNRVYVVIGGRMIPQKYIQVDNRVYYLQDREHLNGLRVFFDRASRRWFCMLGKEKIFLNGFA